MQHPEYLLVPALMVSDYYLTLAGAALYAQTPEQRASYELNGLWRKDVASLRLINLRHLALVGAFGFLLFAYSDSSPDVFSSLFAFAIGALGLINGAHIGNILILGYRRRLTDPVTGGFAMTARFRVIASALRYFGCTLPLVLIAVFHRDSFIIDVLTGAFGVIAIHGVWALKADGKNAASATAARADQRVCAFCGLGERRVNTLITGKSGAICNTCVATCVEVLAGRETGDTKAGPGAGSKARETAA